MKNRNFRIIRFGAAALLLAVSLLAGCKGRDSREAAAPPETSAVEATSATEEPKTITIEQETTGKENAESSETDQSGAVSEQEAGELSETDQSGTVSGQETRESSKTAAGQTTGALPPEAALPDAHEFTFADLDGWEFYFSSGAGGWYTVLHVHEDGTFDGHFQDSDMGDATDEYPNGTLYYSDFFGKFTEPEKVDDMTYRFQIASIEYPLGTGEEIKDGFHYYYDTAYGLDGAEELLLYLPGTKLAGLPEEYRRWVGYYNLNIEKEPELPYYGLYNVTEEEGFSSSDYRQPEPPAMSERAAEEIADTEERVAELEEKLQNAQTQSDMNELSGQIYTEWDNTLNTVWLMLKETMDAESMEKLTVEERAWIAEKEQSVKEAGTEFEGGSMQPLAANTRAAEMTKERVYELAEYLK